MVAGKRISSAATGGSGHGASVRDGSGHDIMCFGNEIIGPNVSNRAKN